MQAHEVDSAGSTATFRQFHVDQIGGDMKDSICRVSDGPFDAQENVNIPTVSYEVRSRLWCQNHACSKSTVTCARQRLLNMQCNQPLSDYVACLCMSCLGHMHLWHYVAMFMLAVQHAKSLT